MGVTHTYTVTVTFTIGTDITDEDANCQLISGESGTGTLNTATATYRGGTIQDNACQGVPFGGGEGKGGGGGGQPPTDTLVPTDSVSAASGPVDGISWILLILLSATVILSTGWVIRRVRTSEI